MFIRRTWHLLSAIALTASGLASSGCCTIELCDKKPRSKLILVKPGATAQSAPVVSAPLVAISKTAEDEIVWKSTNSDQTKLQIEITVKSYQLNPFVGLQCGEPDASGNRECPVFCPTNDLCVSGKINPEIHPEQEDPQYKDKYRYAYGPRLLATGPSVDPGFIIKK